MLCSVCLLCLYNHLCLTVIYLILEQKCILRDLRIRGIPSQCLDQLFPPSLYVVYILPYLSFMMAVFGFTCLDVCKSELL